MEQIKAYEIVKGNTDGSLFPGDIIWFSANGDLNCCTPPSGCIAKEELNPQMMDFEAKESSKYVVKCYSGVECAEKRIK